MITINLVNWRDAIRIKQKRVLKNIIILALSFSLILSMVTHFIFARLVNHLSARVHELKYEVKRQNQLRRVSSGGRYSPSQDEIRKWYEYREATKTLFSELRQNNAKNVAFTAINRNKNKIVFVGEANSAADLTEFLKAWPVAHLFSEIRIEELSQYNNHLVKFRFSALENITLINLKSFNDAV